MMMRNSPAPRWVLAVATLLSISASAYGAKADSATVIVPDAPNPPRYAEPPSRTTYVVTPPPSYDFPPAPYERPELYRSPFRLHLGPQAVTTGRGLGAGLGLAGDFGTGSVGFRLSAAWFRGEPTSNDSSGGTSPLGEGLAQFTGEITLDFFKRGPFHPVFGFGIGYARAARGDSAGSMGIGTARLGFEYALGLDDADVRLGAGITGVLPGPADQDAKDVKGYALIGATLGVGF
jgi:hypothetical protein